MLPSPKFTKNTAIITTPESVIVINHQASRFGPEAFINIGIAYLALGLPAKMKEEFCHLRFRGDLVLTADERATISAWIAAKGTTDGLAVQKLLGFLAQFVSIPTAKAMYRKKPALFGNMLILRDLRAALDA